MAYEFVPDPKTNSPSALIETNTFLVTDTTLYVDHVEYFPDATSDEPGIAVLGRGEDCETITYTGKTGTSGSGTLTGITREVDKETIGGVEFGTKKQWEIGDDVACVLTAFHLKKLIANATRNTPVTSTSDPTVNDDSGDGYEVGKIWINTTSDEPFICADNSSGAAVWVSMLSSGILNNFSASADPTTGDDSGDGYSVGSLWINTTDDKAFVCLDASSGAAIWHEFGATPILNNFSASAAPATTDDSSEGYSVGSRWIDTTADKTYECVDATEDAAVWHQTDASGGSGSGDYPKEIAIHGSVMRNGYAGYKTVQVAGTLIGVYYSLQAIGIAASPNTDNIQIQIYKQTSGGDPVAMTGTDQGFAATTALYTATVTTGVSMVLDASNNVVGYRATKTGLSLSVAAGDRLYAKVSVNGTDANITNDLYWLDVDFMITPS